MKKLGILLLLLTILLLVGCKKNGDDPIIKEPIEVALGKFSDNNYEISVGIFYYNQLEQTIIIKVDGNKTEFIFDDNNLEFYVREDDVLTSYVKDGETYVKEEDTVIKNDSVALFNNLNKDWFNYNEERARYNLRPANLVNFEEILNLGEDFLVKSAYFTLDDNNFINFLRIHLDHQTYNYYYEFTVKNYGEVTVTLPSGGDIR